MNPGNNADRDLAERGKQSTKDKEKNARRGEHKDEEHPSVPPGLEENPEKSSPP